MAAGTHPAAPTGDKKRRVGTKERLMTAGAGEPACAEQRACQRTSAAAPQRAAPRTCGSSRDGTSSVAAGTATAASGAEAHATPVCSTPGDIVGRLLDTDGPARPTQARGGGVRGQQAAQAARNARGRARAPWHSNTQGSC